MLNPGPNLLSLHSFIFKASCWIASGISVVLLSGCQGMLFSPSRSQVRIIDVSPDAPEMDVYQNSSAIAYRLAFGTITSYVPVDPGAYTTTAMMSGTRQALTSSKATFTTAGQYTVLIGSSFASLQQLMLKDQNRPAPPGQVALRFINQATRVSPVDIYLIPAGQKVTNVKPIVTGSTFGSNTGYLNVPAGTYTLVMEAAGTVPTGNTDAVYAGAQVVYAAGSAGTVILIDQNSLSAKDDLQLILASDYAPSTASEPVETAR
jgi:hypothetical protein